MSLSVFAQERAADPAPAASGSTEFPLEKLFAGTLRYRKHAFGEPEPLMSRQVPIWAYSGPRPAERTDNIEAQVGVHFGFLFFSAIEPPKGQLAHFKFTTRVPEPGIAVPGGSGRQRVFETDYTCIDNMVCAAEWHFQDSIEIVPGDWTFEISTPDGAYQLTHVFHVAVPSSDSERAR